MGKEKLSIIETFQNLFGKLPLDDKGVCIKGERLLKVKNKNISSYIVPDTVKVICEGAFSDCKNLSSLEIGESVKTIGSRAIPKKISQLIVNNKDLWLTKEVFEGKESSKDKMVVIAKLERKDSIQSSLKEIANVVSVNERTPLGLGKNKYGQELSYATVEIEIKNQGALLHYTAFKENKETERERAELVFAKEDAPLSIKVYGSDGKIIYQGNDFIVDGTISGFQEDLSTFPTYKISEEWKKSFGRDEELLDDYVMRNTFRELTTEDFFSGLTIKTSSYKIFQLTGNNTIKIKFKIRVIDGKFYTSKLNFIELPVKSRSDYLKEILSAYPFILNLVVYDNDIYSGEVEQNFKSMKGDNIVKEFMLTSQYTPSTFSTNILEYQSPDKKDKGKWWVNEDDED